jgi:catalase
MLDVEITLETGPSVLYDAVVVPDGQDAIDALSRDGHALEFVRDQYRHCKPILALGAGAALLQKASIPTALPDGSADPGLVLNETAYLAQALASFKALLGAHRSFARETDPPMV